MPHHTSFGWTWKKSEERRQEAFSSLNSRKTTTFFNFSWTRERHTQSFFLKYTRNRKRAKGFIKKSSMIYTRACRNLTFRFFQLYLWRTTLESFERREQVCAIQMQYYLAHSYLRSLVNLHREQLYRDIFCQPKSLFFSLLTHRSPFLYAADIVCGGEMVGKKMLTTCNIKQ